MAGLQVERCFGQYSFAGQNRPANVLGDFNGPIVILVVFPRQGDKESGIGDGFYPRENPLRLDTSRGPPLIMPANSLQA